METVIKGGYMFLNNTKKYHHPYTEISLLFIAQIILGMIGLTYSQWSFAQCTEEQKMGKAMDILQSDDYTLQRSAAIFLSTNHLNTSKVIESIVHSDNPYYNNFLPISLLGESILPDLFSHLQDRATRSRALWAICLLGELEPTLVSSLQQFMNDHPTDKELEAISLVFSAALAPKQEREHLLHQLETLMSDSDANMFPDIYSVAVSFVNTKAWGLHLMRKRLAEAINELQNGGQPIKELVRLLVAYGLASKTAPLPSNAITLLKTTRSAFVKNEDVRWNCDVAISLILWMAEGKKIPDLDQVLKQIGIATQAIFTRENRNWFIIFTIADSLLQQKDIPFFIDRANNPQIDENIRIGAMFFLGFLGAANDQVHQILIANLHSESEAIRWISSSMIGQCIDFNGQLYSAVQQRLDQVLNAAEQHVRDPHSGKPCVECGDMKRVLDRLLESRDRLQAFQCQ